MNGALKRIANYRDMFLWDMTISNFIITAIPMVSMVYVLIQDACNGSLKISQWHLTSFSD